LKHLNRILVALVAAALVVPAAVVAKGPGGDHGKSGAPHGKAKGHTPGQHVNKHCKHQPKVGYVYGGTLVAGSTASNLVIHVTHASKAAKALKGTDVALGADSSKARYNPSQPDFATADLTQWKAQVIGKVGKAKKGCTFENSPNTVRKVVVNGPGGNTGETGPTGPTGTTGTTGTTGAS
jgi:hypothetical protein